MANIREVAKQANVSVMTVSRVINQSGYVKEETRQHVLKVMEEMNYVPNALARSLTQQKTFTLALIVPDITNPFYTTIARGAEDTARKNGYRVILCNSDEDVKKEKEYIDMCLSIRVDGVLIAPAGDQSKQNLQKLCKFSIPFVLIDREVKGIKADLVKGDSVQGARLLVQHLIDLGHQNIAMIAGPKSVSTSRDRLQGYREALEIKGIPFRKDYVIQSSLNYTSGTKLLDPLLQCNPRPTAILAANNIVAAQVVKELREKKLQVPKDIALATFDDTGSILTEPYITSAIQPAYNFGTLTVQILIERMDGAPIDSYRNIVLSPEIVIRESTKGKSL